MTASTLYEYDLLLFLVAFVTITGAFVVLFRRAFSGMVPRGLATSPGQNGIIGAAVISAAVLFMIGLALTGRIGRLTTEAVRRDAEYNASALRLAIEGKLTHADRAVQAMSGSPWIVPCLQDPSDVNRERAYSVLERYRSATGAAVCYLLDSTGLTIVSSNRGTSTSFEGQRYAFRPYFLQAMEGRPANYFALGVTSGKRGYYAASPVYDSTKTILGVAVIKFPVDDFEPMLRNFGMAFMTDSQGIVFAASRREFLFRPLYPLSDVATQEELHSRQFGTIDTHHVLSATPDGGRVRFDGNSYLAARKDIADSTWSVVYLAPATMIFRSRLTTMALILLLILCGFIGVMFFTLHRTRHWLEKVIESESRFRAVFENAPETILIADRADGRLLALNPTAHRWLGTSAQEQTDITVNDILREVGQEEEADRQPLHRRESLRGVYRLQRASGSMADISVSSAPISFRQRRALLIFAIDITALLKTQRELEESRTSYRELAESLPQTVFEMDINGNLTYANTQGFRRFGFTREEFQKGLNGVDLMVPEDHDRARQNMMRSLKGETTRYHEYVAVTKDGTRFPVIIHSSRILRDGKPVGLRGIIVDMSERIKMERELQRAEKLDSLGILAGGIAHDFNNILAGIRNGISFVKMHVDADNAVNETLESLDKAIDRGKTLTSQLVTYSKGGSPVRESTSLKELAEDTARFVLSGSNVSCAIEAPQDLWHAHVDSGQISQMIQNLLINATHAMPGGGTVTIRISNRQLKEGEVPPLTEGRYLEMTVSDQGGGIAPDILPHIFDPFFTTKPKGTGLGLATAYSIVKKHGGTLTVHATSSQGTNFMVRIPASEEIRPKAAEPAKAVEHAPASRGIAILLVDDEAIIRSMGKRLLGCLGHTVTTAASGDEAVRLYRERMESGSGFDVVIIDLTMPGMGGNETMQQLRTIDQAVVGVVSSGYSDDEIMARYEEFGFKGVIAKPYSLSEIGKVIRALTGNGRGE